MEHTIEHTAWGIAHDTADSIGHRWGTAGGQATGMRSSSTRQWFMLYITYYSMMALR